jgi:hypothetical protein
MEIDMSEPIMDKPPVYYDDKGVAHVKPADILRSRVGQAEIHKAAAVLIRLGVRPPGPLNQNGAAEPRSR